MSNDIIWQSLLRSNTGHRMDSPLKCRIFPDRPTPFSPVHKQRKFSAVFGAISALSSISMRPCNNKKLREVSTDCYMKWFESRPLSKELYPLPFLVHVSVRHTLGDPLMLMSKNTTGFSLMVDTTFAPSDRGIDWSRVGIEKIDPIAFRSVLGRRKITPQKVITI